MLENIFLSPLVHPEIQKKLISLTGDAAKAVLSRRYEEGKVKTEKDRQVIQQKKLIVSSVMGLCSDVFDIYKIRNVIEDINDIENFNSNEFPVIVEWAKLYCVEWHIPAKSEKVLNDCIGHDTTVDVLNIYSNISSMNKFREIVIENGANNKRNIIVIRKMFDQFTPVFNSAEDVLISIANLPKEIRLQETKKNAQFIKSITHVSARLKKISETLKQVERKDRSPESPFEGKNFRKPRISNGVPWEDALRDTVKRSALDKRIAGMIGKPKTDVMGVKPDHRSANMKKAKEMENRGWDYSQDPNS